MGSNKGREGEEPVCRLCGRQVGFVSRHHLLPRQEGGKHTETVDLCQPCHSTIHLTFSNQELARRFRSIADLQQAEPLQKYLRWIRDKPIDRIRNRRGKRR
jgi:5-methylcytosine-specific restriction enzyme A